MEYFRKSDQFRVALTNAQALFHTVRSKVTRGRSPVDTDAPSLSSPGADSAHS